MLAANTVIDTIWGRPIDVLARLAGTWQLARTIDTGATMAGDATFTARDDGCLRYHERGRLRLANGQSFDAERRYLFRAASNGFSVFFAEQPERLFHEIVLSEINGTLRGHALHPCRDDHYLSTYEFHRDGSFSIEHAVSGPAKSYCSRTRFTRLAPAPG